MSPALRSFVALLAFLALTFSAAAAGARFMPGEWYAQLSKPLWNPPSWIFGPAWTFLYACMAVAVWLVWRKQGLAGAATPIALWIVQLGLNSAWSWLFFGLHRPDLAFVDICALWIAITTTMTLFWRTTALAGALFVPYVAWVSFAAVLNFTIWRMNSP